MCILQSEHRWFVKQTLYKYLKQMSFWFCYGFGTHVQNIITGNIRVWSCKVFMFQSLLAAIEFTGNWKYWILIIIIRPECLCSQVQDWVASFTDQCTKKSKSLSTVYSDWSCHNVCWVLLIYISFLSVIQLQKGQVFSYALMKNKSKDNPYYGTPHNKKAFSFCVHRALNVLYSAPN